MPALDLELRHFPARFAELGFSVALPRDWAAHELPLEDLDFGNPAQFAPMAVVTAPHSAIVFAFAARPSYADGCLSDWAAFVLARDGMQLRSIGRQRVGPHQALAGEAVQPSDIGPMLVRFAFIEDGGRLIHITLSCPEMLAGAMAEAWFATLYSFVLARPRGARVALFPPTPPDCILPAAPRAGRAPALAELAY